MRFLPAKRRLATPAAILVAVAVLWLLHKLVFSAYWLVGVAVLAAGTCWLVRPELRMLRGSAGDRRPWMVRLREHRWRSVPLGGGYRLPRGAAYFLVALLWWLWL